MTMDGTIRSDEGLRALEGRAGESALLYHPEGGIIALRSDNALAVWRPASGHTDILISDVPAPVTSLHFSAERRSRGLRCRRPRHDDWISRVGRLTVDKPSGTVHRPTSPGSGL